MKDYTIRSACRLCDALLPDEKCLDLGSTPLANEYLDTAAESLAQDRFPLYLKQCTACGHVQLPVVVDPKRLWGPQYPYQSGTSPVFRKHLESLADEIAAMKPGGRVLEIASNDGTLCRMIGARGCRVFGCDPSGVQSEDPTNNPQLNRISWPYPCSPQYDCIVALNVFAHVDDLHGFTTAIAEALAPDGVCIIEVGYLPDVVERGLFDTVYHEHLSYHSIRPLIPFFKRHGLSLSGYHRIGSQGGSIRLYVRHSAQEFGDVLVDSEPERVDVAKLQQRVTTLRYLLGPIFNRGCDVVGCSAKLTTFLHACDLGRFSSGPSEVFDDNPLKVGKFVPGTATMIEPVRMLYGESRDPKWIMIGSWNFAQEMIPRLRSLGFNGPMIVPLPELVVYE